MWKKFDKNYDFFFNLQVEDFFAVNKLEKSKYLKIELKNKLHNKWNFWKEKVKLKNDYEIIVHIVSRNRQ